MKSKIILFLLFIALQKTAFGQNNELDKWEKQAIQQLIGVFQTRHKIKIAGFISYPLSREYPLKDVKDKNDFIKRFDEIFDNQFLNKIANSKIKDWSEVGWRGIMFDNGAIWIDDGKIRTINYQSPKEKQMLAKAIQTNKNELPKSLQNFEKPVYLIFTKNHKIRIDKLVNDTYRYTAWKINKNKSAPDIIIDKGVVDYLGSGGNHTFIFKNNEYTYSISINIIGADNDPDALLEVSKEGKVIMTEDGAIKRN
jgi:hypothetical protein